MAELPVLSGFAVAPDGLRLYWRRLGSGPAIVCCNGVGVSIYFWKYVIEHYSRSHTVLVWDYRGHGRSDRPPDIGSADMRVERHAEDLATVMDAAGIDTALLIGHSMGCQVLYEYYRRYPRRVLGLVPMLGTAGHTLSTFFDYPGSPKIFALAGRVIFGLGNATHLFVRPVLESPLSWWFASQFGLVDGHYAKREDLQTYLSHIASLDMRIFIRNVLLLNEHDAWEVLPRIQVPTLVIAAERDAFTPMRLSRKIVASIPDAEFLVLADGTHAALIEQPATLAARIDRFIRERGVFSATGTRPASAALGDARG